MQETECRERQGWRRAALGGHGWPREAGIPSFVVAKPFRHPPKIAPAFLAGVDAAWWTLRIAPAFAAYRPSMGIKKPGLRRAFI